MSCRSATVLGVICFAVPVALGNELAAECGRNPDCDDDAVVLIQRRNLSPFAAALKLGQAVPVRPNSIKASQDISTDQTAKAAEPPWAVALPGNGRIPRQLLLTSKMGSIEALPPAVQKNVKRTLQLSPDVKLRLLGDTECEKYIEDHYDKNLAHIFEAERRGNFRGDICRAAVLAREGGFYLDLDVELNVPLEAFVDKDTTFVSSFDAENAVLNAVLGAEPRSPIMLQVIQEIRTWYDGVDLHRDNYSSSKLLGTVTMLRALRAVVAAHCPSKPFHPIGILQWACGDQFFRFYQEQRLHCGKVETEECPKIRMESKFAGVQFGIYTPDTGSPAGSPDNDWSQKRLVAWSRFADCSTYGCAAGGYDESRAAVNRPPLKATAA